MTTQPPLSEARIPDNAFAPMRSENLARWPTGAEVGLGEAVAFLYALPGHQQLAVVAARSRAVRRPQPW